MQTTLCFEELAALVRQCEIIDKTEDVYLSIKQAEWLYHIIECGKKQRYWLISEKAVEFMFEIASGKYKEVY